MTFFKLKITVVFLIVLCCCLYFSTHILHAKVLDNYYSYDDTVLVVNDNSATSTAIADYFINARNFPLASVVHIFATTTEIISEARFADEIKTPIENFMATNNLVNKTNYIILTKDIPIITREQYNSVDGQLVYQLNKSNATSSSTANPYYRTKERFSHEKFDMYLVTRLDGRTLQNVYDLIDRSALATTTANGAFVFDIDPSHESENIMNKSMRGAYANVVSKGFNAVIDNTSTFLKNNQNVLGYFSWGSNDPSSGGADAVYGNTYVNGAIGDTVVSTSARTMNGRPSDHFQSLIVDLVEEGISGAQGYVGEPFTTTIGRPNIQFDRYTDGFNLADSLYMGSPYVAFKNLVIGDPKTVILKIAPFNTLLPESNTQVTSNSITFSWQITTSYNGPISKYQLFIDGILVADNIQATSTTLTLNLNQGLHTWYVKAVDSIGDSVQSSISKLSVPIQAQTPLSLNPSTQTALASIGTRDWNQVAVSKNGQKMFAVTNQDILNGINNGIGYLYSSNDGGTTWASSTTAGIRIGTSLDASSNGNHIVYAGRRYLTNEDQLSISHDGGVTWNYATLPVPVFGTTSPFMKVQISEDGQKIALIAQTSSSSSENSLITVIITSSNGGSSWQISYNPGLLYYNDLSMSADGNKLLLSAYTNGSNIDYAYSIPGYLYTSEDFGLTWVKREAAGRKYWLQNTMSSDGKYMTAIASSSAIVTSSDGGVTWYERTSAGIRQWVSISASADGRIVTASTKNEKLYVSNNYGVTWNEQSSSGNGNWTNINTNPNGTTIIAGKRLSALNSQQNLFKITIPYELLVVNSTSTEPSNTSCGLSWQTYTIASSSVYFGETSDNLNTIVEDAIGSTTHSVTLTNLTPQTTYYYKIVSNDEFGNTSTSSLMSFTTLQNVVSPSSGGGSSGGGYQGSSSGSAAPITNLTVQPKNVATSTIATTSIVVVGCEPGHLFNITTGARCTTALNQQNFVINQNSDVTKIKTITANLTIGSNTASVKTLQQFLNQQGFIIAFKGPGSRGNETTYFGTATRSALMKFQQSKGIAPASGFFGALTRSFIQNH